ADAIDRRSNLLGTHLFWVKGRLRRAHLNGTHLHSLNALKCSRNPANAAFAMHSFNRQRQHVLHENSPLTGLDAYTPQGYSSCSNFVTKRSILRAVSTKHCIPRTTPIH